MSPRTFFSDPPLGVIQYAPNLCAPARNTTMTSIGMNPDVISISGWCSCSTQLGICNGFENDDQLVMRQYRENHFCGSSRQWKRGCSSDWRTRSGVAEFAVSNIKHS